ncbi:DUF2231 domain-containing protein [uncultured Aquabacterium sp.]|uniref:DUF2231 domain-containing protein n=1 Tax=Aquabacterium sp. TaxID=1872578 RepID=UPI0025E99E6A|nr:DUF2231 domain-containing protein [uncultured Aquabacterium sp.]
MEARVKLLGHPVHQMLVVFPLGLLGASVVFDILYWWLDHPIMIEVAFWTMAGGVLAGLVAAPFGVLDWLAIPKGSRARHIGRLHGLGNVIVILLFGGSWLLRSQAEDHVSLTATALSLGGVALALVTAWLGGELVSRLGIGVSEQACVDAPSSLDEPHPNGLR